MKEDYIITLLEKGLKEPDLEKNTLLLLTTASATAIAVMATIIGLVENNPGLAIGGATGLLAGGGVAAGLLLARKNMKKEIKRQKAEDDEFGVEENGKGRSI